MIVPPVCVSPFSAQRRPEHKPRRHPVLSRAISGRPDTLNEGRSINPGDTRALHAMTDLRARCAQRRPEHKPRRHEHGRLRGREPRSALNEGRSINPGDTRAFGPGVDSPGRGAQRRPEHKPRRHPGPRRRSPGSLPRPLNEGRSINPGDTSCIYTNFSCAIALNEGRSINPGDTRIERIIGRVGFRSTKAGA